MTTNNQDLCDLMTSTDGRAIRKRADGLREVIRSARAEAQVEGQDQAYIRDARGFGLPGPFAEINDLTVDDVEKVLTVLGLY